MAKEPKGFVLYQEDLETLNEMLEPSEAFAVILALSEYSRSGYIPEKNELPDGARMAFAMMKKKVDAARKNYAEVSEKRANAAKQSKTSKAKQNEQMHAKDSDGSKTGEYDSDTESEYESDPPERRNVTRAPASAPTDDGVEGIDGTDLSDAIKLNAEVDALLRQYKLSEAVRGGLMDEIANHGMEKVKRVMQEAAESDTKGGLSLRFIRACLANDGKAKPTRISQGSAKACDSMLRYSPEERKKTYSAAILDFDDDVG